MNPKNKKAINIENLTSIKKPVKGENLRQRESKNEAKSSESYERSNLTEPSVNKKGKKQFHNLEKTTSESEGNERENKFLGKKTKNIRESKDDKRKENKERTCEKAVEMEKVKKGANIHFISIDDSDSESDNDSRIDNTEIINKERKERTIFAKSSKQKVTESDLSQIFKKYGTISKVKLISDYSALVEFINKTSVDIIMNNKNKIFFKGNILQIEKARKAIHEKLVLKKKKITKYETRDDQRILNAIVPGEKEEKEDEKVDKQEKEDEKFINIEIKEGKLENKDRFSLFEEKFSRLANEVTQLKKENAKRVKEIDDLKISLNIIAQINEQRDIQYKSRMDVINKNMRLILNSYKLLYIRKLANIILEQIYIKYSDDLGRGKIQVGKNKHNIFALLPTSQQKYRTDYYQINLTIDFLRFIWDKCSSIIHLQEKDFPLQIELFHEYLKVSGSSSENIDLKEGIAIDKLINLIFNDKDSQKSKRSQNQRKNNLLANAIKKLLKNKKKPNTTNKNANGDNFIIQLTDSDDSDEIDVQYDEKEIKNVVKNNLEEFNVGKQIKKLIKLIVNNNDFKNLIETEGVEINCKYLYNKWKETFKRQNYKKKKEYQEYFKEGKITTLEEMGKFVCKILKEKKLKIFITDPKGVDKNIKKMLPAND